jgi:phage gp45-like
MKNFLGQDGFIWWIGVVEDVNDPMRLGRFRVRCFGYHPPKKDNAVPKEDLPWATPIHPINTPNLYATPNEGDWVFGFFMDGPVAQEPAVIGYIPAIPQKSKEYFGAQPRQDADGNLIRSFSKIAELAESEKVAFTPNTNVLNYVIANIRNPQAIANAMRIFNLNTAQIGQLLGIPESQVLRYFNAANITSVRTAEANSIASNLIRWDSKAGHYLEINDISGVERVILYHANGYSYTLNNDGAAINLVRGPSATLSTSNVITLVSNSQGSTLELSANLNYIESPHGSKFQQNPNGTILTSHANGSTFSLSNDVISFISANGANVSINSDSIMLFSHIEGSNGIISNTSIKFQTKSGHLVNFDDEEDKITIKHKGGTQIVIDTDGKITVTAEDDVEVSAKNITFNVENAFQVTADTVSLNGTTSLTFADSVNSYTPTSLKDEQDAQDTEIELAKTLPAPP